LILYGIGTPAGSPSSSSSSYQSSPTSLPLSSPAGVLLTQGAHAGGLMLTRFRLPFARPCVDLSMGDSWRAQPRGQPIGRRTNPQDKDPEAPLASWSGLGRLTSVGQCRRDVSHIGRSCGVLRTSTGLRVNSCSRALREGPSSLRSCGQIARLDVASRWPHCGVHADRRAIAESEA